MSTDKRGVTNTGDSRRPAGHAYAEPHQSPEKRPGRAPGLLSSRRSVAAAPTSEHAASSTGDLLVPRQSGPRLHPLLLRAVAQTDSNSGWGNAGCLRSG